MARGAMIGGPSKKQQDDYQAEDDHRTLQRAEEVRSDPHRMRRVATHHRKKMGEMRRVGNELGLADPSRKIKRRASMARSRSGR